MSDISVLSVNTTEILKRFFKYLCEGLMVAIAAYVFPKKKMEPDEIIMIAVVASATFAILDMYAPAIGVTARQGAGFGIGASLVGFPGGGLVV
jgi:hypothetical protein|tara:strand:- start:224 stop:502 length:279 start_codon:yes stop_codon:yes gene_type:complete